MPRPTSFRSHYCQSLGTSQRPLFCLSLCCALCVILHCCPTHPFLLALCSFLVFHSPSLATAFQLSLKLPAPLVVPWIPPHTCLLGCESIQCAVPPTCPFLPNLCSNSTPSTPGTYLTSLSRELKSISMSHTILLIFLPKTVLTNL